jgi:hypothetical protein
MNDDPEETKQRVTAWYALRDAKAAMQEMIAEAARTNDARIAEKLNKWLPVIVAAEKHVSNVIADLDASKWMDIRPIAVKLRQLGKRKSDEIAGKIEQAVGALMDG